jgi:hypothetical protein
VTISSPAEIPAFLRFVAYQSVTTGALAAAESGVRLLTQAAIEKRSVRFIGVNATHRFFMLSDIHVAGPVMHPGRLGRIVRQAGIVEAFVRITQAAPAVFSRSRSTLAQSSTMILLKPVPA